MKSNCVFCDSNDKNCKQSCAKCFDESKNKLIKQKMRNRSIFISLCIYLICIISVTCLLYNFKQSTNFQSQSISETNNISINNRLDIEHIISNTRLDLSVRKICSDKAFIYVDFFSNVSLECLTDIHLFINIKHKGESKFYFIESNLLIDNIIGGGNSINAEYYYRFTSNFETIPNNFYVVQPFIMYNNISYYSNATINFETKLSSSKTSLNINAKNGITIINYNVINDYYYHHVSCWIKIKERYLGYTKTRQINITPVDINEDYPNNCTLSEIIHTNVYDWDEYMVVIMELAQPGCQLESSWIKINN